MIKLSVLSLSYQRAFRAGKMDLFSFVDTCRELDVDGVDFNARQFLDDSDGYLKEIKMRCIQRGLVVACVSVSNNFGKPPSAMAEEIAKTKHWIDRALLLGAPRVRVFAGTPNQQESREETWARCRDALKEVADYGWERGVLVSLQNHNHGALTEYGDDVLRFIREAGPHLSHVWDTGQYVGSPGASGADPEAGAREVLYESLQHTVHLATHVRCKFYRITSGAERWLDYPRIVSMLRTANYNGFCSIVYEGKEDEETDVQKAVTYLRSVLER